MEWKDGDSDCVQRNCVTDIGFFLLPGIWAALRALARCYVSTMQAPLKEDTGGWLSMHILNG